MDRTDPDGGILEQRRSSVVGRPSFLIAVLALLALHGCQPWHFPPADDPGGTADDDQTGDDDTGGPDDDAGDDDLGDDDTGDDDLGDDDTGDDDLGDDDTAPSWTCVGGVSMAIQPAPAILGDPVYFDVTGPTPYVYVGLTGSAPDGSPVQATYLQVTGNGPYTWTYLHVPALDGPYAWTFTADQGSTWVCDATVHVGPATGDDDGGDDDGGDDDTDGADDDTGDDDTGDDDIGDDDTAPSGCSMCGINLDPMNPSGDPSVIEIQALGATHVRFAYKDTTGGNDPDPATLAAYTTTISNLVGAGIDVLLLLCYESFPGKPEYAASAADWQAYTQGFVERVDDLSAHFGSTVFAYEIWNEPDHPTGGGYDPGVPSQYFGPLLQGAYQAVKSHSSSAVVMGGLDSGNPAYVTQSAAATGNTLYADYVGLHPYGQRPDPSWPSANWGFGYVGDLIDAYHTTSGKPVWITETGTDDQPVQAEYLTRMYDRVYNSYPASVPYVTWFCWSDNMVYPFGLLDGGGSAKLSYWNYQTFAQNH